MERPSKCTGRDREIAELFKLGYTYPLLATRFGISESTIYLVIKKAGVSRHDGGQSLIARLRREAIKEDKFFNKYGVSVVRIGALEDALSARNKFKQQKGQARYRGISWELSFADWWEIWEQSGAWRQRGRVHGESKMMARLGDVGPYSKENVRIVSMVENVKESWATSPNRMDHLRKSTSRRARRAEVAIKKHLLQEI